MKRTGIETLESGVKINWDSHHSAANPSAKRNYQRRIEVTCAKCGKWRQINSCALWEYRQGKKKLCWECHKIKLADRNSTGVIGRHCNQSGYIIRTLASFSDKELEIIRPMLRSPSKGRRKNRTEVLEHRAVMALSLGRPLNQDEVVHHLNGKKSDNRLENLELHRKGSHSKTHIELLQENKQLKERVEELQRELDSVRKYLK